MLVPGNGQILTLILITIVPWIELRGSIPYGIGTGIDPVFVLVLATAVNLAIIPLIYFGLQAFYKGFFSRFKTCRTMVERVRRRGEKYIKKYGVPGLIVFVAIPLPGTGAYSGTILAWLLGMERKRAFTSIGVGVLIAAVAVFLFSFGFFNSVY